MSLKEFLKNQTETTDKDILLVRFGENACLVFSDRETFEVIMFDENVILGRLSRYLSVMSDAETRYVFDKSYNLLSSAETDGFSCEYLLKDVFVSDNIFLCDM